MLAVDYPLLEVFWTMLWIFLWIAWITLVFHVIGDIFRSRDLGGGAKAMWTIFVVVLPFLGVFVYVIARGGSMGRRDVAQAQESDAAFRAYVEDAARSGVPADELVRLADLRDRGVLSSDEFELEKRKVLN